MRQLILSTTFKDVTFLLISGTGSLVIGQMFRWHQNERKFMISVALIAHNTQTLASCNFLRGLSQDFPPAGVLFWMFPYPSRGPQASPPRKTFSCLE